MRQAAKEGEDREETSRFARDRFSLPTGNDDDDRFARRNGGRKSRKGSQGGEKQDAKRGRKEDCQLRS